MQNIQVEGCGRPSRICRREDGLRGGKSEDQGEETTPNQLLSKKALRLDP